MRGDRLCNGSCVVFVLPRRLFFYGFGFGLLSQSLQESESSCAKTKSNPNPTPTFPTLLQTAAMDLTGADEKRLIDQIYWSALDILNEDDRKLPQVNYI